MEVSPGEVAMIPRGIRFSVHLIGKGALDQQQQAASSSNTHTSTGQGDHGVGSDLHGASTASSGDTISSGAAAANGSGNGSAPGSAGLGARGYVLEVFQGMFTLPDLGPIGETVSQVIITPRAHSCNYCKTNSQVHGT